MDFVVVTFNGPLTVHQVVEEPDPTMTVGEYVTAFVAAHKIVGAGFVLRTDDAVVDPDAPAGSLAGGRYALVATADTPDTADAELAIPDELTTVDEILGWVFDEPDDEVVTARAQAALAAELARGDKARKGIVEPLTATLDPNDGGVQ